jgi:FlaA1/EpsC-like NDP-sugar epimerase
MKSKKILIFGGAGALGRTLIKRYYNDNEVVIFSRDEHKHYHLLKEYPKVKSIIGDIKDKDSIKNALLKEKPNIVINAAALKHVPVCEDNPYESVKTNIIGHQNVIECVSLCQIETLIFVSTDKACKPINVYGMCKAISEQLYISFAKQQKETKVVIVRYGNVLESTGSVIPYFKDLLEDSNTKTLPITDCDMTRFLLTLEQATDLIHWAYEYSDSHGKIAVPKVKSLKVTDIANVLIDSYDVDVSLKEIGIRPGEKLHEEMVSSEEWRKTESLDNFLLIGSKTTNDDNHSYNSLDYLMDSSEAHDFLKESGVIR